MVNTVKGTSRADVLTGTESDDLLLGYAGADNLTGLGGDDVLDGGRGADTMNGGAGNDIYYVDDAADSVIENFLGGFDEIITSLDYTLPGDVEVLTLTGKTAIRATGNYGDNRIYGNIADNLIDGLGGSDTMGGGRGNDTYRVNSAEDLVFELAKEGTDTVILTAYFGAYVLPENVENGVVAFGTYNANAMLTGNAMANALTGGTLNDTLDGKQGADTMRGGMGHDFYYVDNAADVVIEQAGEGEDSVSSSVSYTLSANIEQLFLTGTAINATGNDSDNQLYGNAGNNVIDGKGGADAMTGYGGDDTYYVDNAGDTIFEQDKFGGSGKDKVFASIDYVLGDGLENLTLTGTAVRGTGNALGNVITGNDGDNVLDGGTNDPGTNDWLIGGNGDDTYIIADTTSVIIEKKSGGIDTVVVGSNYSIDSAPFIENVTLSGTGNFQVIGNNGDNVLVGNSGNNLFIGLDGADTLIGGKGDDTYRVFDLTRATFIEDVDGGTDLVQAYQSFILPDNFEDLTLIGNLVHNLNATGNALDNRLVGTFSANVIDGKAGADYMNGNGGNDTYYVDDPGDVVDPKSSGGAYFGTELVVSSVDFTLADYLDNLTLTGAARRGVGNDLANRITGTDFADTIDGQAGADKLIGGKGDDVYLVDNVADVVFETAGGGTDTVRSSANYVLGARIERLVLVDGAADGTGNALDNLITGNASANTLDGGRGADRMEGGAGDDTYVVDNVSDVVVEVAGGGVDTVNSSIAWTLGATTENLILVGARSLSATGNNLANEITGNAADNLIDGRGGADVLAGGGGNDRLTGGEGHDSLDGGDGADRLNGDAGNDTLAGGLGDDLLSGGEGHDSLDGGDGADRLNGDAGNDTLAGGLGDDQLSGGDGQDSLDGGDGADRLNGDAANDTLLGGLGNDQLSGGEGQDRLDGGDGADRLNGDAGNDTLDGGTGADTMAGGLGDDRYVVDAAGDVVTEKAGEGRDIVTASIDWTLASNVEDLTLADAVVRGTGNAGDNTITGNGSANVLAGGGGGKDLLIGGLGDDSYIVDGPTVTVRENAGEGFDRMIFTASGTMAANVEVGIAGGTGAVSITGSAANDLIGGNAAANVLDGAKGSDTLIGQAGADTLRGGDGDDFLFGGAGADTLTGGAGSDQFAVGAYTSLGVDKITDFTSGVDTLLVINPLVSGLLLAGGLAFGTSAKDSDDVGIYDKASGNLWVDYDANGPQAKILLATFTPGTALAASDFRLIDETSFNMQISPVENALVI